MSYTDQFNSGLSYIYCMCFISGVYVHVCYVYVYTHKLLNLFS